MIKIENAAVYGWEAAIRGMRNPMNSWSGSDSMYRASKNAFILEFVVGGQDLDLMKQSSTNHGDSLNDGSKAPVISDDGNIFFHCPDCGAKLKVTQLPDD